MKAATGELNLTVITIVAIGLVAGLFYAFLWPNIKKQIEDNWNADNQNAYIERIETELL
jgi:nitrogen fixation-related uncharacterized protein